MSYYYSFLPYDYPAFDPFFVHCPCMDYFSFDDVYSSVQPYVDFVTDDIYDIYDSFNYELGPSEFYPFDHENIALDLLRDILRNLDKEEIQNSHVLSSLATHPMLSDIWDGKEPSSTVDGGYSLPPTFYHAEYEFVHSMPGISPSTSGMTVTTPASTNGRKRRNTL
ncbi:hypothetical protein CPC08DRAFT_724033 [Agrocybe pediades]|nr:hypothetical protein CPC08DRAFT_724033 [Agrocybe pediades]